MNTPPPPPDGRDHPDLDEAIPMLTEVIRMPEPAPEAGAADADWAALAPRIRDELAGRLAARAEAILAQALPGLLREALERHAALLQAGLAEACAELARDAATRAVDEALAECQAVSAAAPPGDAGPARPGTSATGPAPGQPPPI